MFSLKNCFFYNYSLICAGVSWLVSQILKFIFFFITEKRFNLGRLTGSGGMPSAHCAAMAGLSVAISRQCGLNSPVFAISAILSAIVMYDANGVRRSSGEQAKLLNRLVDVLDIPEIKQTEIKKSLRIFNREDSNNTDNMKKLKEQLGHTPIEVMAGVLVGIVVNLFIPI